MKTSVAVLCLTSLIPGPALAQDDPPAREVADAEAKILVSTFRTEIAAAKKNLIGRMRAVKTLAQSKNNLLVAPLLTVATSDASKAVRQAAVLALGKQPKKRVRPVLINLLGKTSIMKDPATVAAIVRAIGTSCYDTRDWDKFEKMFNQSLTNKLAADAQRAILEAAGKNNELEAATFLVEHIDAPAPAWVDDPSNPPAAYWEARHKNWQKWRGQVTDSLFAITGQRFGTSKEARAWMKANLANLRKQAKAGPSGRKKPK